MRSARSNACFEQTMSPVAMTAVTKAINSKASKGSPVLGAILEEAVGMVDPDEPRIEPNVDMPASVWV